MTLGLLRGYVAILACVLLGMFGIGAICMALMAPLPWPKRIETAIKGIASLAVAIILLRILIPIIWDRSRRE
jgi:hypothetical protein